MLEQDWMLAVSAAAGIVIILIILILILFVKTAKLKKRYTALMNGERDLNLEELITGIQRKLNEQREQGAKLERQVAGIIQTLKTMKSKVGIQRYSAFGEGGNDLSFTIALLNEMEDGLVLTGIYGRDQTYIYAKPIQKGVSTYTLSPEEKDTITMTMQQG